MKKEIRNTMVFIILGFSIPSFAILNYGPYNRAFPSVWISDTIWVGTGFLATGSEIKVTYISGRNTPLGKLVLVKNDTLMHVFYSYLPLNYPDTAEKNLGVIQKGIPVTFAFVVVDTAQLYEPIRFLNLYSGQNRRGLDPYVTDGVIGANLYRFDIAERRLSNGKVRIGFDVATALFRDIIVEVEGIYLDGTEKTKMPEPDFEPLGGSFNQHTTVNISLPDSGMYNLFYSSKTDTIPVTKVNKKRIIFTVDGSNPKNSSTAKEYVSPIEITATTVLKAISLVDGDTNCFPSEVVTQVYTKDESLVHNNFRLNGVTSNAISDFSIFSINGQRIRTITTSVSNVLSYTQTLPSGVYFLRSKVGGQVKRVLVGRK